MRFLILVLATLLSVSQAHAQCATKTVTLDEIYSATVYNGRKVNGRTEAVGWNVLGGLYSVTTFSPSSIPAGKTILSAKVKFWKTHSQSAGYYSVGPYNGNGYGDPRNEAVSTVQDGITASYFYQWGQGQWIASFPYPGVDTIALTTDGVAQFQAAANGRWPRFSVGYYPLTQAGNIYDEQEGAQLQVVYCK